MAAFSGHIGIPGGDFLLFFGAAVVSVNSVSHSDTCCPYEKIKLYYKNPQLVIEQYGNKQAAVLQRGLLPVYEPADKPGYVLNGHLSSPYVTVRIKRPTLKHDGPPYRLMCGLASDGVYMAQPVTRLTVVSYTAVPPLPGADHAGSRRFISVALSLESPPPDVIRHPAL